MQNNKWLIGTSADSGDVKLCIAGDARYRADNDLQSVHICTEKKVSKMTKIDIISGFLGAGEKLRLLNRLLKEAISGEKVVLIEK